MPPEHIRRLQDYLSLRPDHLTLDAAHVQKMQQALERLTVKLHDAISDLTGVSGLKVIRALLKGERDPQRLFEPCDVQIQKKNAEEVKESLRGTWKAEHLFALGQAQAGWEFYQQHIAECDEQIGRELRELAGPADPQTPVPKATKTEGTNAPQLEGFHGLLWRLCGGQDPPVLPGVADYTLLQLVGEVCTELRVRPSEKHFTAWLGLARGIIRVANAEAVRSVRATGLGGSSA